jgi:hypothetical protein
MQLRNYEINSSIAFHFPVRNNTDEIRITVSDTLAVTEAGFSALKPGHPYCRYCYVQIKIVSPNLSC